MIKNREYINKIKLVIFILLELIVFGFIFFVYDNTSKENLQLELNVEQEVVESSIETTFEQLNFLITTLEVFYRTFDVSEMTHENLETVIGKDNIETFGINFVSIAPNDIHQVVYPYDQFSDIVGQSLIETTDSYVIGQYYDLSETNRVLILRSFDNNEVILAKNIKIDNLSVGTVTIHIDYDTFIANTIDLFNNHIFDIQLLDNNGLKIIGDSTGKYSNDLIESEYFKAYLSLSITDAFYSEYNFNRNLILGSIVLVAFATVSTTYFFFKRNENYISRLVESRIDLIQTMARASEYRDNDTGNHIIRVSMYSKLLAKKIGLSKTQVKDVEQASTMHDIGKIGIPDSILKHKGKYTDEQFNIMKTHCKVGAEILGVHSDRLLNSASIMALEHHERWNGSGYPRGIKGKDIHIYARLCSVADVFDALVSKRVYKPGWTFEDAFEYILSQRGKQFDPEIIDVFEQERDEIYRINEVYKDY